jgi:hypothetical protein
VIKYLGNEEAKARRRAVENTTKMGCNAMKTNNKQTKAGQAQKNQLTLRPEN